MARRLPERLGLGERWLVRRGWPRDRCAPPWRPAVGVTATARWGRARRSRTGPAVRYWPGAACGRLAGPATHPCGSSACTPPAGSSCRSRPGAYGRSGSAAACACPSRPRSLAGCRPWNSATARPESPVCQNPPGEPEEQGPEEAGQASDPPGPPYPHATTGPGRSVCGPCHRGPGTARSPATAGRARRGDRCPLR